MEINEELIACFIEGKCTPDEMVAVRQYLCQHPEKCEMIIALLGNDSPMSHDISDSFNAGMRQLATLPDTDCDALRVSAARVLDGEMSRTNIMTTNDIIDRATSIIESVERRLNADLSL